MAFGFKDKHKHYTEVASGNAPVKQDSKFSEAEQRAYARGQRDARNESRRVTAYKFSSDQEREAYAAKKATEREQYKAKTQAVERVKWQAEKHLTNAEKNFAKMNCKIK